jgi:uncharacterized protein YjbI with pentapeptide repeats
MTTLPPERARKVLIGTSVISVSLAVLIFLSFVPTLLVKIDCWGVEEKPLGCDAKAKIKSASDARVALIQFLLAVGAGGTLFFTWRNNRQTAKDAAVNQALTRESRVSENFVKAVEQLGSDKPSLHIGGIYGLDRVLRATEEGKADYWAIMDVLCTFVRQNFRNPQQKGEVPRPEPAPEDLQAALNVLARRWFTGKVSDREGTDAVVDLHGTNLANTWMANGHFEYGFFINCDLRDADLGNSKFMGSDFSGADLGGAILWRADLTGLDLRRVRGLETAEKLDEAIANGRTRLPTNIRRPATWPVEEPDP